MKISIVIPAYNAAPFIRRCLDSIINQKAIQNFIEIIIINDGSSDETEIIAKKYTKDYAFISVYSQSNQGLSAARNAGINFVKGDYIWFVDADDWISGESLKKILQKIELSHPDVLCLRAGDVIGDIVKPRFEFSEINDVNGVESLKQWKSPCAPFYVFKRDLIYNNNLRFKKGVYHEDSEFTPRALYLAHKVSYLDYVAYNVFANPTSITRSANPKRVFDTLIVCRELEKFMLYKVEDKDKSLFSLIIAISLNSAFYDVIHNMDLEIQNDFDETLYRDINLINHFWKSKNGYYRLEYLLLKTRPRRVTKVYKSFTKFLK